MSRKTSRRLVYTLSSPSASSHGHILGINSLSLDPTRFESDSPNSGVGTLYTAGRDGVVTGWGLDHLDLSNYADETREFDDISLASYSGGIDDYISSQRKAATANSKINTQSANPYRVYKQLHSNWVNDIALTNNYQSLLSCSNDLSVKLWNPRNSSEAPITIGRHRDYVKCVSSPGQNTTWAASGGFDGRIIIWDIAQMKGEKLVIDVGEDGKNARGSIYSLATVNGSLSNGSQTNIVAAGGPEAIVKLWDLRTTNPQKPICEFIGHDDNIRSLLISNDGDLVLSASSDSTIKLWSIRGSKILNTFNMHDEAVWSLYSNHPELKCFYSADRSGLVVKTDLRVSEETNTQGGTISFNGNENDKLNSSNDDDEVQGISTVIANEHQGISSLLAYGDTIWVTTLKCHVNGWKNIDSRVFVKFKEQLKQEGQLSKIGDDNSHIISQFNQISIDDALEYSDNGSNIPIINVSSNLPNSKPVTIISPPKKTESKLSSNEGSDVSSLEKATKTHFLSLDGGVCLDFNSNQNKQQSSRAEFYPNDHHEEVLEDEEEFIIDPLFHNPVLTLEGQVGLIKHRSLPDRRHVLTLDSAGKVQLWDLISCKPLEYFDTDEIDEIYNELVIRQQADKNFVDFSTPSWCQVSTRSGRLFVTLEENSCFAAEIYVDELPDSEQQSLREQFPNLTMVQDQKINLGKWVIKNLLSPFVEFILKNDGHFPTGNSTSDRGSLSSPIGLNNHSASLNNSKPLASSTQVDQSKTLSTSGQSNGNENSSTTPTASNGFKKFKFSLGKKDKKTNENSNTNTNSSSRDSGNSAVKPNSSVENETLGSVLRAIRTYDLAQSKDQSVESSLRTIPDEVPLFDIPNNIFLLVTEMSPLLGGSTDLYRAKRKHLQRDAKILEEILPAWIGNLLFKNEFVEKASDKIFFCLKPYVHELKGDKTLMILSQRTKLPDLVGSDSNSNDDKKPQNNSTSDQNTNKNFDPPRLSAQRNLRVRKIQHYVIEKFAKTIPEISTGQPVEEWMVLTCQGQILSPRMNLGMVKTKLWKSSDDMVLMYRRKDEIFE
ncbi:WD40 repeat-like protein [Nadsonia fulvescens var. elongata DSM 6958]|uniref:WD40 repeat-like protein n=1 Tax=Nadsonia fulvescens var. elongata DSM 6958 TaxID=857566 RepID=A0A1E3PLP3_9ASCO|nr:WD40 repeat-like protein [Nadsonia fulvescens var. elongata DSM 6958]